MDLVDFLTLGQQAGSPLGRASDLGLLVSFLILFGPFLYFFVLLASAKNEHRATDKQATEAAYRNLPLWPSSDQPPPPKQPN